ncbi:SpoIIIAH-like family protein, partial [Frankia sp. Cpl3]|nr:SpoIIIAH-like family protein [Frankia sp. Cpl3]
GYYLVKGPTEQVPALGEQQKQVQPLSGVEVESKQTDPLLPDAKPVEGKTTAAPAADNATITDETAAGAETTSDVFQGYKMKREALLQQQKDEQLSILSSGDATPQALAEAKAK